ncbi:MAG TPA: metallopeptidase TldD-related protein [Holophaga sp.]|nr:metallopeptidase TldD-related protein [Holophaga sp.]HPS66338.1 metallopeptidase TldD-related protein [Holophaga sp.]
MSALRNMEARFDQACGLLFGELLPGEALTLDFAGESSEFMRFNEGKVRQIGHMDRATVQIKYFRDGRTLSSAFETTGDEDQDAEFAAAALSRARREAPLLPVDPYQTLPACSDTSREVFQGRLPEADRIPDEILGPGEAIAKAGADFVGLHAQGLVCRGAASSAGARHWFATETFASDHSTYLPNGKAVKSGYAGREWDAREYTRRLATTISRLEALARPEKVIPPGKYRVYIAPDALNEVVPFFSWNGLGERGLREGESSWIALRDGRKSLSPRFRLDQDFGLGLEPRFNDLGEVAPRLLPLIEAGRLANTLVSARSAKKYGLASNAAPAGEEVRSPSIGAGDLDEDKALELVGTGLYLSNLHYLNWSDNDSGRITGMTRFACFWVEDGRIVSPIKDMRFDESIYHLFGDKLAGLTRQRTLVPETSTYGHRALGGALLPGILVEDFAFTL